MRIRPLTDADWDDVIRIYAEGIATRLATFETEPASQDQLDKRWIAGHRWIAEVGGRVAGWASASPTSTRPVYSGVLETSIYVGADVRGRGIGKRLIAHQVTAADEDPAVWTLQTSIFPENTASVAVHHNAGFRIVGTRQRIGQLDGVWRDTLLLERRSPSPS